MTTLYLVLKTKYENSIVTRNGFIARQRRITEYYTVFRYCWHGANISGRLQERPIGTKAVLSNVAAIMRNIHGVSHENWAKLSNQIAARHSPRSSTHWTSPEKTQQGQPSWEPELNSSYLQSTP